MGKHCVLGLNQQVHGLGCSGQMRASVEWAHHSACSIQPWKEEAPHPHPHSGQGNPLHHLTVRQPQALDLSALGSAKSHTSSFHTICKRFIRKAFLFNIKQVRKKFPQLISASPDFHCSVQVTGGAGRGFSCAEASVGFLKRLNREQYISLLKSHMPFGLNIKVPLRLSIRTRRKAGLQSVSLASTRCSCHRDTFFQQEGSLLA